MQITRQADYAVRAVLYLSRARQAERSPTSAIAKDQNIPPSFLAKIISQLSISGLLRTSRGAHGGVTLAREPKDISLLEVVEAIDGPIQLNECVTNTDTCSFEENCPIKFVWCDAQDALVGRLKRTNFADMLVQPT